MIESNTFWPVEGITVSDGVGWLFPAADASHVAASAGIYSAEIVVQRFYDWSPLFVEEDVLRQPGAARGIFGVEEYSLPLELIAFADVALSFLHALGVLHVELVGKAEVGVEHHLAEVSVAGELVDSLPLVLGGVAAHIPLWAPAS